MRSWTRSPPKLTSIRLSKLPPVRCPPSTGIHSEERPHLAPPLPGPTARTTEALQLSRTANLNHGFYSATENRQPSIQGEVCAAIRAVLVRCSSPCTPEQLAFATLRAGLFFQTREREALADAHSYPYAIESSISPTNSRADSFCKNRLKTCRSPFNNNSSG